MLRALAFFLAAVTKLYPAPTLLGVMALIMASFALFWITFGAALFIADLRASKRAGQLNTPSTRIEDLEDGAEAKLVGQVVLGPDTHVAPLSKKKCAAYRVRVDARRKLLWKPMQTHQDQCGFYVNDGSGSVFVPASELTRLRINVDGRYVSKAKRRAPKALRRLLASTRKEQPKATLRVDEATLVEGTRVAVYGVFRRKPTDSHSQDERAYRERHFHFVAEPAEDGIIVGDERHVLDS